MFITSSFTVAQTGSNPNGYQQENGVNKLLFPHPRLLLSNVKEQATDTHSNASPDIVPGKKSNTEKGTPYDSIYIGSRIN